MRRRRAEMEAANGVRHIPAKGTGVDSAAQVFRLWKLDPGAIDPRVGAVDEKKLRASDACIVNVDYPLGEAAYHILRQVAEQASWMRGLYVLGKAATLNADVGDVMIPNVVHNEHSGNTYWLAQSLPPAPGPRAPRHVAAPAPPPARPPPPASPHHPTPLHLLTPVPSPPGR